MVDGCTRFIKASKAYMQKKVKSSACLVVHVPGQASMHVSTWNMEHCLGAGLRFEHLKARGCRETPL